MKGKLIGVLILAIFILINCNVSIGASSTTYLYLDSIKVDDYNIEILTNEILIDTVTSKIENTIYLKNTSDKEINLDLAIPLENEDLNISIKNLVIKLNDVQVEYVKGKEGYYFVKTKISANSGKKINIEYYTENDLQKAKLIKCNFDNFKGKKVGKLKVDIKIDDKNIPLVEKIYPGHYTFKDNTISVEYYNYEVNTLTKDVIVKKETFNNLLYGREVDLNDKEKEIINNWYEGKEGSIKSKDSYGYDYEHPENNVRNKIAVNILDYRDIKKGIQFQYYEPDFTLLYGMVENIKGYEMDLKGKNVCIDYVETEGEKDLYVDKTIEMINVEDGEIANRKLVKETERNILKTSGVTTTYAGKRGAKIIFVNEGINEECLNATEEEKISYINQINADMYIRVEIYDGKIQYKTNEYGGLQRIGNGIVGYYDNNNSEIVKAFTLTKDDKFLTEEEYNKTWIKEKYKMYYSDYNQYAKNYYNDYYKDSIIKLDNEDVSNKSEVPTVVQFMGYRTEKDGKYIVEYADISGFYDRISRGLATTNATLQTVQAKKMLSANKQKNENIKSEVENGITNLSIVDDEQKIQQSIKDEIEELKRQEELKKLKAEEEIKNKEREEQQKIMIKHILIFSSIGLGIIFCIVVMIREHKKKNNVKKENVNNEKKGTNEN